MFIYMSMIMGMFFDKF